MVDRLPIYVTGTDILRKGDFAHLLGIPRLLGEKNRYA